MRKQTAEKLRKRGGFTEEFLRRAQELKSVEDGRYIIEIRDNTFEFMDRLKFNKPKELRKISNIYNGMFAVITNSANQLIAIVVLDGKQYRKLAEHEGKKYENGCCGVCEFCFYNTDHPDPNVPEYICKNSRMKGE